MIIIYLNRAENAFNILIKSVIIKITEVVKNS